ncbi:hypothetical protein [Thermoactinospora rubra]|uniref:hypothetical protein n=1 Tax=Thermoactinospora rubra TaxID=1088767 RepID=UPI001301A04E|nr:hypothetical protein [Thermoactinospora rubra]
MAMQVKDVMGRVAIAVLESATFGDIVAAAADFCEIFTAAGSERRSPRRRMSRL